MTGRWNRVDRRSDRGAMLLELLVTMAVLTLFFAMFAGAVVMVHNATNHSTAISRTSGQLSQAFWRLDTQVRYASFISVPARVAADENNWYVELLDSTASPATCVQLRVNQASRQLQQRSWRVGVSPGPWLALAGDVVNGDAAAGADVPFVLTPPSSAVTSAQLTLNLVSRQGTGANGAASRTRLTLTALNTNLTTPRGGFCAGQRP